MVIKLNIKLVETEGKHISGTIVGLMAVNWLQELVGFHQFLIFEMHMWRRWGSGLRGSGRVMEEGVISVRDEHVQSLRWL